MYYTQRTFLVSTDILRWFKSGPYKEEKTERFYTLLEAEKTVYYQRVFPKTYHKVVCHVGEEDLVSSVDEEAYSLARKKRLGRSLVKKSYSRNIEKSLFVLERYKKKLDGLCILQVGTQEDKGLMNSHVLHDLQTFILKEIDQKGKYSEASLAFSEKPMEYTLETFFQKIDAFEPPNLFFWQVSEHLYVKDALSLVLYRNIRLLNYYNSNFQNKHFAATLHRLRVLLHRTDTLLEVFPDFYAPQVVAFCRRLLQEYYEETKKLRYLYFLNELCATKEGAKMSLYSALTSEISKEEARVVEMLASQNFMQMLHLLIKEVKVQQEAPYISVTKGIKKVLKAHLKMLEKHLAATKEGYEDGDLEQLYISIDRLQTLIEDFFHIVGEKEVKLLVEEFNILLKPLREYRNCKERVGVLEEMKKEAQLSTLDTSVLHCQHEEELNEKISFALKLLRGSRFYI